MLISEEADADSSSEEDQEMVHLRSEQYARDNVDTEAPQQAPKETPEETPKETPEETLKQSGAPAYDHIDIPLTEEEITILTSGEEEGGTQQEVEDDQPRDQPRLVKVEEMRRMHQLLVSGAPIFPPTTLLFINIFAKYCVFFPVTSQTLENCSEEVRNIVAQLMNGAANTEPTTMTTTTPPVPATPSTSGAQAFFDPVTMSAPQGPLPGKTLLHNLIWCLVFSTKTWWLVCSFVASFFRTTIICKRDD